MAMNRKLNNKEEQIQNVGGRALKEMFIVLNTDCIRKKTGYHEKCNNCNKNLIWCYHCVRSICKNCNQIHKQHDNTEHHIVLEHFIELQIIMIAHHLKNKDNNYSDGVINLFKCKEDFNKDGSNIFPSTEFINEEKAYLTNCFINSPNIIYKPLKEIINQLADYVCENILTSVNFITNYYDENVLDLNYIKDYLKYLINNVKPYCQNKYIPLIKQALHQLK